MCPLYRSHGSRPCNEPWCYGAAAEASIKKSIQLRKDLHPYIMSLTNNASAFGEPLMRPVWWDFPQDAAALFFQEETTLMLGPTYLAAPVLEPRATSRSLYLPRGASYTHYYSKKVYQGGENVTVPAPVDELPLFIVDRA